MALTSIIAKGLALADVVLGYFATSTPVGQTNICGTLWTTYDAGLTACGQADMLADLVTDLFELRALLEVLQGLFAT